MAPVASVLPKDTPKVQRTIAKANAVKKTPLTKTTASAIKKTDPKKSTATLSSPSTPRDTRQRTSSVPIAARPNGNKSVPLPTSVKKPMKSWQRRPQPAHSGVPLPEKLKKLFSKQVQD